MGGRHGRRTGQWVSIGPTGVSDGGIGSIARIHSIAMHPKRPPTVISATELKAWKTTNGGAVFKRRYRRDSAQVGWRHD